MALAPHAFQRYVTGVMSAKSGTRGAPGRARVPRRLREREMVAVAERVFAERGYHSASMDEIATECGVTKPMLYAYFGSKEGLFAACGRPTGERLRARLRAAVDDPSAGPDELLWRGLLLIFRRIGEGRETWMLLYPPGAPTHGGARVA